MNSCIRYDTGVIKMYYVLGELRPTQTCICLGFTSGGRRYLATRVLELRPSLPNNDVLVYVLHLTPNNNYLARCYKQLNDSCYFILMSTFQSRRDSATLFIFNLK